MTRALTRALTAAVLAATAAGCGGTGPAAAPPAATASPSAAGTTAAGTPAAPPGTAATGRGTSAAGGGDGSTGAVSTADGGTGDGGGGDGGGGDGVPGAATGDAGLDAFVATVRASVPEVAVDRRDDEIADIARRACASLTAGRSAGAVLAQARTLGTADAAAADHATARELVTLAVDRVCPGMARRVGEL